MKSLQKYIVENSKLDDLKLQRSKLYSKAFKMMSNSSIQNKVREEIKAISKEIAKLE